MISQEPTFDGLLSMGDLIRAMNWYTQNQTEEDFRGYLLSYLKGNIGPNSGKIPLNRYNTAGIIARIISRGAKLESIDYMKFVSQCELFLLDLQSAKVETKKDDATVINLQERVQNKTDEYIGKLEAIFDQVFFSKTLKTFDVYKWMVGNQIKAVHANRIAEFFTSEADELKSVIKRRKTDSYLKESYPRSDKEWLTSVSI